MPYRQRKLESYKAHLRTYIRDVEEKFSSLLSLGILATAKKTLIGKLSLCFGVSKNPGMVILHSFISHTAADDILPKLNIKHVQFPVDKTRSK